MKYLSIFLLFLSLSHIKQVTSSCNVLDFGAKGDGLTDDTKALQKALDTCINNVVQFPPGKYLTLPLILHGNSLVFELQPGATILGSQNFEAWPTIPPLPSYGTGNELPGPRYAPLIQAQNLSSIAIRGGGTIDGQGQRWWLDHKQGKLNYTRPFLLEIIWSSNVSVEDIFLTNSPMWTLHPVYCQDVVIRNVTIKNPSDSPNTDGIDPDSSKNVLIENCTIDVGDDVIAIKSGLNEAGLKFGMPSENIVVRNCNFFHGHGASIGSEMSGGVRNVTFLDNVFLGTLRGARIKTAAVRGGYVVDVSYVNQKMSSMTEAISVSMFYTLDSDFGSFDVLPVFRDFLFKNISGSGIRTAGSFDCLEGSPCRGINLEDIMISSSAGFSCEFAFGTFRNVTPVPCLSKI
eukprot:TRINITY_DN12900_c0_g1_i1.p1 TRINITY_DN12900_c0_g1~~TRINITY_DN12900_c0_g1_i1.p1  ORF type:complete len:421 (+),score=58.62 TRINITY_DN12900_c0_g1_i1:55-1263(+)